MPHHFYENETKYFHYHGSRSKNEIRVDYKDNNDPRKMYFKYLRSSGEGLAR